MATIAVTKGRANVHPFFLRSFCKEIGRRIQIERFNRIIRYGRPRLAYSLLPSTKTFRSSPAIVILHGMFGSKTNWKSLAKVFNQLTGSTVITFDARNHGESEHHSSMCYEAMTYDTINLLAKLNIKKSILIGHSMGGKTAMNISLHHPEIVDKLIVVDSAPKVSIAAKAAISCLDAMTALDLKEIKSKRHANEALKCAIKDDSVRQFIITNLEHSPDGMKWIINLNSFHRNLTDLLGFPYANAHSYHGQTLFIAGKNSDYITSIERPEIARLFPKAQIEYIDNAGHWVHADQPMKFLASVCNFLKK